jgi:DNA polymerase beta
VCYAMLCYAMLCTMYHELLTWFHLTSSYIYVCVCVCVCSLPVSVSMSICRADVFFFSCCCLDQFSELRFTFRGFNDAESNLKKLTKIVKQHGGTIVDVKESLDDMEPCITHVVSNKSYFSQGPESDECLLDALAADIPVVTAKWIEDSDKKQSICTKDTIKYRLDNPLVISSSSSSSRKRKKSTSAASSASASSSPYFATSKRAKKESTSTPSASASASASASTSKRLIDMKRSKAEWKEFLKNVPKKNAVNHNEMLTDALDELKRNEFNQGDQYKGMAYNKASSTLKQFPEPILSGKEASRLPGIGAKIAAKIDEIIETGGLQRLDNDRGDEKLQAINDLTRVHGIGRKHAQELYDKHDIKSLQHLAAHQDLLTDTQKLGFKYLKDLEQRIPREEVQQLSAYVKRAANDIDTDLILTTCGSYRRGESSSSDIDILITHKEWTGSSKAPKSVEKIVPRLDELGFLVAALSHGKKKYMGICKLPETDLEDDTKGDTKMMKRKTGTKKSTKKSTKKNTKKNKSALPPSMFFSIPSLEDVDDESDDSSSSESDIFQSRSRSDVKRVLASIADIDSQEPDPTLPLSSSESDQTKKHTHRRIDIRFIPKDRYPAALTYFTGPDSLNRDMRVKAQEMNMKLSEYGLVKVDDQGNELESLPVSSEEDVFAHLNMPYQKPQDRR